MKRQKVLMTFFIAMGLMFSNVSVSAQELEAEKSTPRLESKALETVEDEKASEPSVNQVDKSLLQVEYDKALLIDQSILLQSSKDALNLALDIGKARLASPDTNQTDINEAKDKLISTVASLVKKGDSSKLKSLYLEAEKIDRTKLTLESEARLSDAMMLAKGLLDSGEAAQEDLDAAYNSLSAVLNNLDSLEDEVGPDTSLLKKEILKAQKIHVDNKEEVSKRRFLYALDQARQALLDESMTQEAIDDLLIRLQNAQKNLVTDENYVDVPVLDDEKLSDEDVLGKPLDSEDLDKEVLPATGMGSLGLIFSNSMIFSGFALILKDRKNK